MPVPASSRTSAAAPVAPRLDGEGPWYAPEPLRKLARRRLTWAHLPVAALDDVELCDTGAADALAPLLRADTRAGADRLWHAVAAEAVAGRLALLAAARWCGAPDHPWDAVVSIAEVVAESLALPMRWRGDQRPRLDLLRARDGLVALQTPTAVHRELLAACIGPAAGDLDAAVANWVGARLAAAAEEELQQCSIPALAVGAPTRRGIAALPAPIATWRGLGLQRRAGASGPRNRGPLGGVRVIELGGLWAAPLATRLLADLGAGVIKLEMPQRPDGLRRGAPAHFAALNRGKRRLALDLRLGRDRDRLLSLLGPGTLIVENLSPRVLPNLGLAAERLASTGAAVVSLPPRRGRRGGAPPQRVALGSTIEMAAGLGLPDPVTGTLGCAPLPFTDALTGIRAALAGVAALRSGPAALRLAQVDDVAAPLAWQLRTGQL